MPKSKDINCLVTFYDPNALKQPINYIVKGKDLDDIYNLAIIEFESEPNIDKNFSRLIPHTIIRLSDVKRINEKKISVKQAMKMISNPEHFVESVKLFQKMIFESKLNYSAISKALSPYSEFVNNGKMVKPVPPLSTKWKEAISDTTNSKFCKLVLSYYPKNKPPFKHKEQVYMLWVTRNPNQIELQHIESKHTFIEFFVELRKIIPDLPARLEQIIIEAM
jgi:hypothetical protein